MGAKIQQICIHCLHISAFFSTLLKGSPDSFPFQAAQFPRPIHHGHILTFIGISVLLQRF